MPEIEKQLHLDIFKPHPVRFGRRRLFTGSGIALVCLLAQNPQTALALPQAETVRKPKTPKPEKQLFHTIVQDRFGQTDIVLEPGTQTGSLDLITDPNLADTISTPPLFRMETPFASILEQHRFDEHHFAYIMAGVVNPRATTHPYRIGVEIISEDYSLGVVRTPWLTKNDVADLQELSLFWDNAELIEAIASYK